MGYSNVGTPVFYIDNYLYHKTIGTTLNNNITSNIYDNPNYTHVNPSMFPNMYTLNPSVAQFYEADMDNAKFYQINIPMPSSVLDYNLTGNIKWYFAMLNHHGYKHCPRFIDDEGNFSWQASDSWQGDFEPIFNSEFFTNEATTGSTYIKPLSGSSIYTYTGNTLPLKNVEFSGTNSYNIRIGAVSTGIQYTMPHSPDLNLTMEVEFDGIKKIRASGGNDLYKTNYVGNPVWINGDNKTNPFDVYDYNYPDYNALDVTTAGARRNGRKSWSLKFSYLSDSDLFSSNLKSSSYTEHPNDSTYETSDLDGLDADGNPISTSYLGYNIETDDSFYAQVWNKTLGGALPFIFQPNSQNKDEFYICKFDQDSLRIRQSAHKVYDISVKIVESW